MFRPIRVDHTNCLQVAIKTQSIVVIFGVAVFSRINWHFATARRGIYWPRDSDDISTPKDMKPKSSALDWASYCKQSLVSTWSRLFFNHRSSYIPSTSPCCLLGATPELETRSILSCRSRLSVIFYPHNFLTVRRLYSDSIKALLRLC